jgi:hypothetical protein
LKKSGIYDIYEIVPTTINSANNALYIISNGNEIIDSTYLDQNEGSGSWRKIGSYQLNSNEPVSIKVVDSGESTAGPVIRADAVKFSLIQDYTDVSEKNSLSVPSEFELFQNYPNPFNNSTLIKYSVPKSSHIAIKVYNILGQEIATLVDKYLPIGRYQVSFSIQNITSGVYLYKLASEGFTETKKMILLK